MTFAFQKPAFPFVRVIEDLTKVPLTFEVPRQTRKLPQRHRNCHVGTRGEVCLNVIEHLKSMAILSTDVRQPLVLPAGLCCSAPGLLHDGQLQLWLELA